MKKYIIVGTILCSIVLCALVERHGRTTYLAGEAHLREQTNDLENLRGQYNQLSAQTNHVTPGQPADNAKELADLRTKAEALMKQTNELGVLLAKKREANKSATADSMSVLPDDPKQVIQLTQQTMTLSMAFFSYADEHSNQAPPDMEALRPYFNKLPEQTPPDAGAFEVIYHGSLDQLDGIPVGSVAVMRTRQVWQGANGKLRRVYGMADGSAQQIGSDDNFQSYEALHVILDGQGGQ